MGERLKVRGVSIEDEAGVHDFGPARAAIVLAFGSEEKDFSVSGEFLAVDLFNAAKTVGLIAGIIARGLGEEGAAKVGLALLAAMVDGIEDVGRQAEICAESALNEMGVRPDGR